MSPIAINGNHADVAVNGHNDHLEAKARVTNKVKPAEDEQLALNTVRCLGADLCQQFKGGHPGTVMGAAAIGVALWRYHMRYNPLNPNWFGRDRFVLSAGHACLFQYIFLHLTGYPQWTMEQLKYYHSPDAIKAQSMAAGHPEIEYPGIEVTTGPLGQGIANAVGMAMAGKQIEAQYSRDGFKIAGERIWCFSGDGCIQEGVGQEAISMAGHLGLDNLILIYDDNSVTVDGRIDNCFTDDTSAKFKACGWDVLEVYDGSNDLRAIIQAFDEAKKLSGKPIMVHIRTVIGFASRKANTGPAHGQALGDDEVAYVKGQLGFNPSEKYHVPEKVREYFSGCVERGQRHEQEWTEKLEQYSQKYPEEAAELKARMGGGFAGGANLVDLLPPKSELPTAEQPTRKSSGIAVQALVPKYKNFIAGSADLLESTFVNFKGQVEFQKPSSGLGDYTGRQVRYGIREFSMVAIGNGMAAYQKGMFIPIMSTFFMFWLYAAPAARMSALQHLRFVGIATHDAIGIGEDGPTHQPVALAAFYRALPNFNLIRPADAEECMGAWEIALQEENTPSLFTLSRQPVPLLPGSDRKGVHRGAYIVQGADIQKPDVTLVATGAEVARAVKAAAALDLEHGIKARVVSMPSQGHFDKQPFEYRQSVLPTASSLVVAIEAWAANGWAEYAHASMSMHTFGLSAPQAELYEHFGFGIENITSKVAGLVGRWRDAGRLPGVGEFDKILLDHASH